jgi:hypothetical protein
MDASVSLKIAETAEMDEKEASCRTRIALLLRHGTGGPASTTFGQQPHSAAQT